MFTDPRGQDLHELGLDDVAVAVAVVRVKHDAEALDLGQLRGRRGLDRAPKHGGRRVHFQDEVSETKANVLEHDKEYNLEQDPARLAALVYARARVRSVTGLDRAKRDHVALREGVETTVTPIILAYASTVAHSPMDVSGAAWAVGSQTGDETRRPGLRGYC
ncbi:hypothetical protein PsorP6_016767 [Peronosclerospora sorghi]|uniref:Uncharacterized protein n=1 Tax=Peronosclerospora sorghi TaxID=230839 RepID=A0ACC0WDZ8_9STRA|nr:hypothetical protein PsorP6_016767 [Peronosclerospora sorghi]